MSKQIDERVVSMQFDNKDFEKNVETSRKSIAKLEQSLKLKDASKGLENVQKAADNVDFKKMEHAAYESGFQIKDAWLKMWSMLEYRIGGAMLNLGKQMVSAFTIDPIKTGLAEYETQINAVQTILANTESKGTTLDDVNGALDELNAYADKTIYNFTEMTRNIGTFTAAGTDLDTSVKAIKGIANLAAVSGSNSQQASTAMYQLSQALSSGTVKLMDWNSVVNAGMGGQVFQDALKETARVHGIAIDDMIESEGSFRETLSEGWLTSEILTETLEKFTICTEEMTEAEIEQSRAMLKSKGYTDEQIESIFKMGNTATNAATKVKTFTQLMDTLKEAAQSGWTQTWEILIGDFEEAKELWTGVSDVFGEIINSSSEARNAMLQGWKDLGGRAMIIDAVKNAFEALMSVLKPIGEAFREVFPRTTAEQLLNISKAIKDFTSKLILSEKAQKSLKSVFKGLFAVIDIGITIIKEVVSGVFKLVGAVSELLGPVATVGGSFGDFMSGVRDSVKESGFLATVIGGLVNIFKKLISVVKKVADFFADKIAAPGFEALLAIFQGIWKVMSWIGDKVGTIFSTVGNALGNALRGGEIKGLVDIFNSGVITAILLGIRNFTKGLTGSLSDLADFGGKITEILDSVKGCFTAWQSSLKADALKKIAIAIAILTASLLVLSMIDPTRLTDSLGAITVLFAELLGSMALFNKIGGGQKGTLKSVTAMIGMSIAVLILSSALKKISGLDTESMTTGLLGVAGLAAIVVGIAKVMSQNTGAVMKGAGSLILFAAAIKILASACKDLSSLSWQEMFKGLIGVGVLMATVALFLNNTKFSSKGISTATGIVIMAAAMKILASACADFGAMKLADLGKGLGAIAAILAGFALFTKFTGNAKKLISTGTSLVLIAASMKIFASAVRDLGMLSIETIGKGLLAMAGALAMVTIAVNLMPKNLIGIGIGMIALSTAILIMSAALTSLGGMSWESVAKGLVSLGGALTILTIALHAMSGTLAGTAALLIATAAIALLVPSLLVLGMMSWESILKGLVGIAGAFTVLGVAGLLLGPLLPVILGLAAALVLISVAVVATGAGILALAIGITALATALTAGAAAIVAGITIIIQGIINLIPAIVIAIGEGVIGICNVLAGSVGAICSAITAILTAIFKALTNSIPPLMECISTILDAVIDLLIQYVPKLVVAGIQIVVGLLQGIAENIGQVIEAGVNIIVKFLQGIGEAIPKVIQAGFDLIIAFLDGLITAIDTNIPIIMAKVQELFKAILRAAVLVLTGGIVDIKGLGEKIMNSGFIQGIKSTFTKLKNTVTEGLGKAKTAIKNKIGEWKETGRNIISGLIQGIGEKLTALKNKIVNGVKGAWESAKSFLGINSPSKLFAQLGVGMDEGLIVGLQSYSGKVAKATENVGNTALNSMSDTISGLSNSLDIDMNTQPTIRPVLDLSDVKSGANSINSMFGMNPSVGVLAKVSAINASMNNRQDVSNADVVSAIDHLAGLLGKTNTGNTYNINGVTYDDGSNIATAIESIVRAARIERRT